ncbi:hypothetical protein M514_04365 [Trichuris suis]|uniref:Uncharacterized protein n=1 Tax=Trichuris suis TaxID=68888 RepID=A0A085N4L0_9BILA|nr:hypothetical protein M514_04365 [Trichuris suis]
MNMNLEWYFANITDEESAAAFLREKGVFHRERSCLSCHQQVQLGIRHPNGSAQWKCTNKAWGARISARTPRTTLSTINKYMQSLTNVSRGVHCTTRHQLQSQMGSDASNSRYDFAIPSA